MSVHVTITMIGCGLFDIKKSMCRYALSANYIQWKENDQSKKKSMYIDGRLKETGNIAGFINSTRPSSTNKQPNCIFEVHEGN